MVIRRRLAQVTGVALTAAGPSSTPTAEVLLPHSMITFRGTVRRMAGKGDPLQRSDGMVLLMSGKQ